ASQSIIQSNTPLSLLGFVTAANGNTLSFSGLTGLLNPPTVDISQTGVLNFQVTQTNTNGCTSLATPFSLTIQPSIPATQTVCRSTPTVLTSITVGTRYEWYKNGTSAPFKLTEIASIQKGTQTASLTIVSTQTTASYYLKIFAANGSFVFEGPFKVTVDYGCTGARQAAPELADVPLSVVLMPNPIANGQVRAVVRGAGGQFLRVTLLNLQGQPAGEQHWTIAEPEQTIELSTAGQPSGMYLLQAQTPGQRTIVKVIKP
ncbi:MAG: T9SS type A sorting domain-containing protein, partial [Spirosoma sp.]|nr:T9SS type A sorting domain-containing protein [Spirosoma sp.]